MTRDQAIGVLRVLTAAWPNATLTDDTVELWVEYFATVGAEEARIVASDLVLGEQWMPTIARFREAVVGRRRREAARFASHALPSGERVTPLEDAMAHVGELRQTLSQTTKGH